MAFNFRVEKAERTKVPLKVAFISPSGDGKTFSSLRLATGMATELERINGKKAKILLGNTERGRGRYYADQFDYDIADLESPFSPQLYIDLIDYAEQAGYDILILDSTSPEWEGIGGCLDQVDKITKGNQSRNREAWKVVTPQHDAFINKIVTSNIHIIATMRGKDQWVADKNEKGKTEANKIALGAKQRDNFEYEFTCVFTLTNTIATQHKDNTHLFDSRPPKQLDENDGELLVKWANSGKAVAPVVNRNPEVLDSVAIKDAISEIDSLIKVKVADGVEKKDIAEVIKKFNIVNGKADPNFKAITDIQIANQIIEAIKNINV
jgi:hypothetical protein